MHPIIEENWGKVRGQQVKRYTLASDRLSVSIINFGATIQRITYGGKDMIVSLPDAETYARLSRGCIGATVGRYAGRINGGRFSLDGTAYQLTRNQDGHHLHGGNTGFGAKLWDNAETVSFDGGAELRLRLFSPDGEEGYPGDLHVSAVFRVTEDDTLTVAYQAEVSKKDTIVNLTNHCYFTPNGFSRRSGTDNRDVELMMDADHILELNHLIPTGKLLPVDGTPFDFRIPKPVSRDMADDEETASGYDHTFVFRHPDVYRHPDLSKPSVVAYGVKSGIQIECFTNQPGAQLFTMGNPGDAFALETQHFPDSPNHPDFPSTRLRVGDKFSSETVYRFSVRQ